MTTVRTRENRRTRVLTGAAIIGLALCLAALRGAVGDVAVDLSFLGVVLLVSVGTIVIASTPTGIRRG